MNVGVGVAKGVGLAVNIGVDGCAVTFADEDGNRAGRVANADEPECD